MTQQVKQFTWIFLLTLVLGYTIGSILLHQAGV